MSKSRDAVESFCLWQEEDAGQQDHEITQQAIYRIEATNDLQAKSLELERIAKDVKEKEQQLKDAVVTMEKESAAIDRRQDKINRLTNKLDSMILAAGVKPSLLFAIF